MMDFEGEVRTKSAQETAALGKELAIQLKTQNAELNDQKRGQVGATTICLYGELGSGKTTFAQGFAKGLGITSRLLSPTFIIVRRYQVSNTSDFLYHLDLYRVGGEKDLYDIGIAEILADTGSYVLIEWAEKLTKNLPEKRIDIWFTVRENGKHHIKIRQTKI
ncbi:tRNA (adenosine(37)-N6)-threonylcarbamoyltransferase complex ATPase subunit type 1 TsaE [Candidatus Gottesmanbacteria bacterium]|nr:tRNA (adenosine(37)-N6)-threonylcarbamoyltransferase complex ATPase subunit type 1 TsaE [Candidatus Gottesmanbacteria bacterium]